MRHVGYKPRGNRELGQSLLARYFSGLDCANRHHFTPFFVPVSLQDFAGNAPGSRVLAVCAQILARKQRNLVGEGVVATVSIDKFAVYPAQLVAVHETDDLNRNELHVALAMAFYQTRGSEEQIYHGLLQAPDSSANQTNTRLLRFSVRGVNPACRARRERAT